MVRGILLCVLATKCLAVFAADPVMAKIPLTSGVTFVSAQQVPEGDRENIVTISEANAQGVRYKWEYTQTAPSGEKQRFEFGRAVSAADLAGARAMHTVFRTSELGEKPGNTAFTFSTQLYDALVRDGSATITSTNETGPDRFETMPGTLTLVAPDPIDMSVLVNGRRVTLPTLQVRGLFKASGGTFSIDYRVLADRTHPWLLRAGGRTNYYQTVRIEIPAGAAPPSPSIEQALQTQCRAELPGVYFAFATAELDSASNRTLSEVARVLAKQSSWKVAIEGHTDNIGTDIANLALSQARADAVRTYLIQQHKVDVARLTTTGFGANQPRETNHTLEGRARNRRVELVRACG